MQEARPRKVRLTVLLYGINIANVMPHELSGMNILFSIPGNGRKTARQAI